MNRRHLPAITPNLDPDGMFHSEAFGAFTSRDVPVFGGVGLASMVSTALTSKKLEKLLNAAFETSDLRRICHAVDGGILQFSSIIEVARVVEVDRVTLYSAFRLEKGPAFDTMIKVL